MEVTRRIAAGHLDGSDQRAAAGDEKRSAGGIGGDVARCDLAGREGDRDEVDGVRFVRMTRTAGDRSRHRRSERLSGSFLPTPQSHVCTCASSRCYACSLLTCLRTSRTTCALPGRRALLGLSIISSGVSARSYRTKKAPLCQAGPSCH